jgi:hypothetical protein
MLQLERLIGYGCIGKQRMLTVRSYEKINKNLLCEKSPVILLSKLAVPVQVLNA